MKISVIFTGGTIGSVVKNDWIGVDDSTKYKLLSKFDYQKDGIEFVACEPYSILSENLSANELNLLQKEVSKRLSEDFDGIIVTHGTDTLQYSAAALEYAFGDCNIPIVLVSADYPLEDDKTNGYANFEAAVEFIKSEHESGVFVSYRNEACEHVNIHIATHILLHGECCANIYSIGGAPYAEYDGEIRRCAKELSAKKSCLGIVDYGACSDVLVVESYPANCYAYSLDHVRAVILRPYHSATVNTQCEMLAQFSEMAAQKGIPIFIVNVKPGASYESTKLFEELGIKVLPYSTFVSAYMKIWAGISRGCDIEEFAKTAIANEFCVE